MDYDSSLLTQTQDPMALEMAAFKDDSPPMSKEDFGIITTTQEGILNTLQIMSNEIANHTDIILKKIKDLQTPQPAKVEYKKKKETTDNDEEKKPKYVCYTCGTPGHCSPNCPQKGQNKENKKPTIKSNECFNCGEEGHWANKCPHKLKGYCGACQEEGHTFKDCPYYDSYYDGPDEKLKGQRIANKKSACYTCGETGHWSRDCPNWGPDPNPISDIEEDEPPKKVMKITKEKKRGGKKQKKEDWDEELKKQQKIPGRMKRINKENVFVEEPDLD